MATDVHTDDAPVTKLVTGIISDAQDLIKQQMAMFQLEFREEFKKTKEAAVSMMAATSLGIAGLLLLGMAVGFLIPWIWPAVPVWGGFAIAALLFLVAAACFIGLTKKQAESVHALPEKSVQALKENVQWITKH